jgi:hypothetical protein
MATNNRSINIFKDNPYQLQYVNLQYLELMKNLYLLSD